MTEVALEVLSEVHAGVEAGDLVRVTVEYLGGDGVGEGGAVDAALVGLGPARVIDGGIDVGKEAVFVRADLVPGGVGLFVSEMEADDGLAVFEAVLPGHDDADGSAVLVGEGVSVGAEGEQGKGIHGLIHAEAFGVGPVVAARRFGHLMLIEEGGELDIFGRGKGLAEVDELGERVAVPGDDHGPGLHAAVAIDAGLDGAVGEKVVDADGAGLLDHAGDVDGPGAGAEGSGVDLGLGFVGAELVEVVVAGGLGLGRLGVGDGVFAGNGLERGAGGVDGAGTEEAGDVAGQGVAGGGGDAGIGGSGEEAAAGLAGGVEVAFGGDLGGLWFRA